MSIEENIQRIADALETIAKWDQMQIDWLTERREQVNTVPIADQVAEKPKAKTFGKAKKIEQEIDEAEEEMTGGTPPWDVDDNEKVSRTTMKPKKKKVEEEEGEEDEPPKKPVKKAPPKKKPIDDDDFFDDEEDDEPPAKPVKKPSKKKLVPVVDDDDDEDFDI